MVRLVLISIGSEDQFKKAEELFSNFGDEIFITDSQTLKLLVAKRVLTKNFNGKLYVLNPSFPEEDSLKLFTISKPDHVIICDETGKLEVFSRFIKRVSGLRISEC